MHMSDAPNLLFRNTKWIVVQQAWWQSSQRFKFESEYKVHAFVAFVRKCFTFSCTFLIFYALNLHTPASHASERDVETIKDFFFVSLFLLYVFTICVSACSFERSLALPISVCRYVPELVVYIWVAVHRSLLSSFHWLKTERKPNVRQNGGMASDRSKRPTE